mgnify:CR=1 FL=1
MNDELTAALPTVQMRTGGGAGAFLRKVGAIAMKDLRAELRGRAGHDDSPGTSPCG